MAMLARDVRDWVSSIPPDWTVAIDEGGLTLVATGPNKGCPVTLEIGGEPEDADE